MDERQKELNGIADRLSALVKHGGIPARHKYAAGVVRDIVSQLRTLANKDSVASWSAPAESQGGKWGGGES